MKKSDSLPLKKVVIQTSDYFRPKGGGSGPKMFGDVTTHVRNKVAGEVKSVGLHFESEFRRLPMSAAIARVVLKDEALAKSHRPLKLFEEASCPIVGVGSFGELLVSVRQATLPKLERSILTEVTKEGKANISTIKTIEPFQIDSGRVATLQEALEASKEMPVKVRLFRHQDSVTDRAIEAAFHAELERLKIRACPLNYASSVTIYKLEGVQPDHIVTLAKFVGTQSLGSFPDYYIVRPAAQPVGKLSQANFPPPVPGVEYPIVGVIDSGIARSNPLIEPWIVGREIYVAEGERDYEHGTFVGGLVIHSRALNHGDSKFPLTSCKVLDVVAVPKGGRISESELIAVLREVVPKHPEIKVWNISLAGSQPCSDYAFSDLAIALDEVQTQCGVTFVLAAGNYQTKPYRSWPPENIPGEADRICSPADSTRAVTVGSMSHRDSPAACVPAHAPSPFSRRGPGPGYLTKPEICHYGGNCDPNGMHAQIGVLSVDSNGNLAESVGTSFAAPIAASILAHIQARPSGGLSNLMAKALLIHSAVLKTEGLTAQDSRYKGFGVPADPAEVLSCQTWNATLLFEVEIRAQRDFHRHPFPIPKCLLDSDSKLRSEVTITLVYEPPLDPTFGVEYCRGNINVSFGTYDAGETGQRVQQRQVHPFPRSTERDPEEKTLVEHGFKWSPVKVYRRVMPKGVSADAWRLILDATDRSGAVSETIRAAVVLTIADIDKKAPVYNDVVTAAAQMGWSLVDIQLQDRIRPRV